MIHLAVVKKSSQAYDSLEEKGETRPAIGSCGSAWDKATSLAAFPVPGTKFSIEREGGREERENKKQRSTKKNPFRRRAFRAFR